MAPKLTFSTPAREVPFDSNFLLPPATLPPTPARMISRSSLSASKLFQSAITASPPSPLSRNSEDMDSPPSLKRKTPHASPSDSPQGSSSLESPFKKVALESPESPFTPKAKSIEDTPSPVKTFIADLKSGTIDRAADLTRREVAVMTNALTALKKVQGSKQGELVSRMAEQITPRKDDPKAHKQFVKDTMESEWVGECAATLHQLVGRPVIEGFDLRHIATPDDGRGCHLYNANLNLRNIIKNPITGIFTGTFTNLDGKEKSSTFFPTSISTEKELLGVMQNAKSAMHSQNKRLSTVEYQGATLHLMQYLQNKGAIVKSCFPLMFVGSLSKSGEEISIAGLKTVQSDDLIKQLTAMKATELQPYIEIRDKGELLLDLAKLVKIPGIEQGICFRVEESLIGQEQKPQSSRQLFFSTPVARSTSSVSQSSVSTAIMSPPPLPKKSRARVVVISKKPQQVLQQVMMPPSTKVLFPESIDASPSLTTPVKMSLLEQPVLIPQAPIVQRSTTTAQATLASSRRLFTAESDEKKG